MLQQFVMQVPSYQNIPCKFSNFTSFREITIFEGDVNL